MRECPWCHKMNLNVYAYCQGCGRGWAGPGEQAAPTARKRKRFLIFG